MARPAMSDTERMRREFEEVYGPRPTYEGVQGEITSLLVLAREWDIRLEAWQAATQKERQRAAEICETGREFEEVYGSRPPESGVPEMLFMALCEIWDIRHEVWQAATQKEKRRAAGICETCKDYFRSKDAAITVAAAIRAEAGKGKVGE